MSVKVTIRNKTLWPTKMLLPFVRRIAREEFPGTKPSNTRTRVTVDIIYNRGGGRGFSYCSGYAYLNSSSCTVRVPYPHPGIRFPVMDFCHVVGHEFGHCKGLRHKDMGLHYGNSCARGSYSGEHYAWAKALPVPVLVKKAAPTTAEKRAARLKTAEAAVLRWTRKKKFAENALKRWTRKVRALTKLMADIDHMRATVAACGPAVVDTLSPPVVES